ncbi:MAG: hypothetical protein KY447_12850 [Actinobacteria bacterium]|nr:hypothetical protein [Actinomycetota bacterium]
MEHLPPVGWADVAAKRDLDHLGVQLRAEMSVGFAGLGKEMNVGFAEVRTELHKEIAGLRADMARQTSTLLVGLLGLQVSAAALTVGVSRLM